MKNTETKKPFLQVEQNDSLFFVFSKLSHDKIQINWNKNPIEMKMFLSFLTVEVKRISNHSGSCTGWTLLENDELKLKIGGGIVNGKEWLDSLQLGHKLNNKYNNYVNPFYLFSLLSDEGRKFFIDYYKDDIDKMVLDQKNKIQYLEKSLVDEKEKLEKIKSEIEFICK